MFLNSDEFSSNDREKASLVSFTMWQDFYTGLTFRFSYNNVYADEIAVGNHLWKPLCDRIC